MNIKKPKTDSKKKPFIIGAIIAVCVIVASVLVYINFTPTDTMDTKKPSTPQQKTNKQEQKNAADQKRDFLDKETQNEGSKDESNPVDTKLSSISLEARIQGNDVVITTNLASAPSGTCTLTVTDISSKKTVTKTADVIYTPEQSSCAGFTVPKTSLDGTQWSIRLDVKTPNGDQTKTISFNL